MASPSRQAGSATSSAARAPTASVRVDVTATGTHLLLVVRGEVDLFTAPALRSDLSAALACRPRSVTLDLSGLTYCDLSGLDVLDDFWADASVVGLAPVVHGMSRRLAWLHATFPVPHGMPPPTDRSAAREGLPARAERRRPNGGHFLAAGPETTASPRAWPER